MNDTEILNLFIEGNHLNETINMVLEQFVDKNIEKSLSYIVEKISSLNQRIFQSQHIHFPILIKLYQKYVKNNPTKENFKILLSIYDGNEQEFLDEYKYETLFD